MRSPWKGPFIDFFILRKKRFFFKMKVHEIDLSFSTSSRRSTIMPFLEKSLVKVYNGNKFFTLNVKPHHIGHKFGSFFLTKKKCIAKKKKNKGKKKINGSKG